MEVVKEQEIRLVQAARKDPVTKLLFTIMASRKASQYVEVHPKAG